MVDHTFSKMKFRQQLSSTAINIIIVKIAEMIYLTRHLLTKTKVHQQAAGQLGQKGCGQTVCGDGLFMNSSATSLTPTVLA